MKPPKKIRDRYVRPGQADPERVVALEKSVGEGLPVHEPNTDPKSTVFMLGLIFFLEPEHRPEQKPFPEGGILICD